MTKEELGQLYPIIIKPFNPKWKMFYQKEKELLQNMFSSKLLIEHIGSTAIAGLSAKPTIDILIEKPDYMSDSQIIEKFTRFKYIHMKETDSHLMFVKGYTPTGLEEISYHIHMESLQQQWLWDRIFFRDYLIQNERLKKKYEALKIQLAKQYKNDREAYTNLKTDFITKVTNEAKALLKNTL